MAPLKLTLPLALAALLLGGAGAYAFLGARAPGGEGAHRVLVEGPHGPLFEGHVRVDAATALSVLEAAAREAGLALEVEEYPGMGAYVRAVGPHRAQGPTGWVYEVRAPGAEGWTSGDRSAALYGLAPGDEVRWRWTEG